MHDVYWFLYKNNDATGIVPSRVIYTLLYMLPEHCLSLLYQESRA